ncbi:hypothetical protein D3C81_1983900 [compost metagenome]
MAQGQAGHGVGVAHQHRLREQPVVVFVRAVRQTLAAGDPLAAGGAQVQQVITQAVALGGHVDQAVLQGVNQYSVGIGCHAVELLFGVGVVLLSNHFIPKWEPTL